MTVIDTPAGIANWYFLSAVSQLTLELKTGQNFYGKTSAYTGIRRNMIQGLPPRATVRNKLLALATLLDAAADEVGNGVIDSGRKVLAAKLEELGLEMNRD